MRFLCLHGRGTNSHVFQTQSATIRYEMDKHHVFDFVEGTIECQIDAEIKDVFPAADQYFRYFWDTADSLSAALQQLSTYLEAEGPFDGVFAFSQGVTLITTYLIQLGQQEPRAALPFRCAIFLSGLQPVDPGALQRGELKMFELNDGSAPPPIGLPTAHIRGQEDSVYGAQSEKLVNYCATGKRAVYVHAGGHEIPGPRAKDDVQGAVRAIRRTIDRAETEV